MEFIQAGGDSYYVEGPAKTGIETDQGEYITVIMEKKIEKRI